MKDIEGWEGLYAITKDGRVWSYPKYNRKEGIFLKIFPDTAGYSIVELSKGNIATPKLVHRLVAKAYLDNPENKEEVNHKNGLKSDNILSNLEWVTPSENIIHSFVSGFRKRKLSDRDVIAIRNSKDSYVTLANLYGITQSSARDVRIGKLYKRIK